MNERTNEYEWPEKEQRFFSPTGYVDERRTSGSNLFYGVPAWRACYDVENVYVDYMYDCEGL